MMTPFKSTERDRKNGESCLSPEPKDLSLGPGTMIKQSAHVPCTPAISGAHFTRSESFHYHKNPLKWVESLSFIDKETDVWSGLSKAPDIRTEVWLMFKVPFSYSTRHLAARGHVTISSASHGKRAQRKKKSSRLECNS